MLVKKTQQCTQKVLCIVLDRSGSGFSVRKVSMLLPNRVDTMGPLPQE